MKITSLDDTLVVVIICGATIIISTLLVWFIYGGA